MHWYIVASQKEAKILVPTSNRQKLTVLNTLPNKLGAVKKRELIRKKAGRGVKSIGRVGTVRYSQPKRHDPHEVAIVQFARELAAFLEAERHKRSFESLTVVAEPHLLGRVRAEMSANLSNTVTHWIKRDLQKSPERVVSDFLLRTVNRSELAQVNTAF